MLDWQGKKKKKKKMRTKEDKKKEERKEKIVMVEKTFFNYVFNIEIFFFFSKLPFEFQAFEAV